MILLLQPSLFSNRKVFLTIVMTRNYVVVSFKLCLDVGSEK